MIKAESLYAALLNEVNAEKSDFRVLLGLNWSLLQLIGPEMDIQADRSQLCGICFSPSQIQRTNSWSGRLHEYSVNELASWILEWDPAAAVIGALAVNVAINGKSSLIEKAVPIEIGKYPHLSVFDYFRPKLAGKKVAVIGHYPNLEPFPEATQWHCIERNPRFGDLPDIAAEFVLPESDWVFITASSIVNKTLPGLLRLSAKAKVVLMGPSLPWMASWKDFGVDYLAGIEVMDLNSLWQIAAEGGGTRIFENSVRYRVLSL